MPYPLYMNATGHTTLKMTKRYWQAVGCYDALEAHKHYSPADRLHS